MESYEPQSSSYKNIIEKAIELEMKCGNGMGANERGVISIIQSDNNLNATWADFSFICR